MEQTPENNPQSVTGFWDLKEIIQQKAEGLPLPPGTVDTNARGILLNCSVEEWDAAQPLTSEETLALLHIEDRCPPEKRWIRAEIEQLLKPKSVRARRFTKELGTDLIIGTYRDVFKRLYHAPFDPELFPDKAPPLTRREREAEQTERDSEQYREAEEAATLLCQWVSDNYGICYPDFPPSSVPGTKPATKEAVIKSLNVVLGDQLEMQVVQWFWDKKFASRELNVLCGMPDRGKGTLLADLIARVTTGTALPGETGPRVPAGVLIFSGEETIETTTLPRVVAAGGNRSRLHFVRGVQIQHDASREDRSLALDSDGHLIRDYLKQHPEIRLVVLDPVNSYFSGDKNSSQETRKVYGALKAIADECDVCFVLVDHFNKNTFQNALHRINGAQDAGAAPRSAWVIEKDEDNPEIRHLACLKCNIISDADKTGWEFKIVSESVMIAGKETSVGRVEWLGVSKKSAEELVSKKPEIDAPQLKTAKAFYQEVLDAGKPRPQSELYDELTKLGVGERTAKRAMREMSISVQSGLVKKMAGRWWLVPSGSETETGQECQEGQGCQP